jgi:hypothetical protein
MLARSSQCLLLFSVVVRLEWCPIEGDFYRPPVDDACIPIDITLSSMSSMRISSIDFSNMLASPNIHTCNQIDWVGKWTSEVNKHMERSRNNNAIYNRFSISLDNHGWKKVVPVQHPMG